MEKETTLNIFNKAEAKTAQLLRELNTLDSLGQSWGLKQIQQTSYFLEKINPDLFFKIVKDTAKVIDLRRQSIKLSEVTECQVVGQYIHCKYHQQNYQISLISFSTLLQIGNISKPDYSGKYIQIGFLLRLENYLDLSLVMGLQGVGHE